MSDILTSGTNGSQEWLQSSKVQSKLDNVLLGCDDGELYFEKTQREIFEYSDQTLKMANVSVSQGFGLRAVCGQAVGFAHSNKLTDEALSEAAKAVSLAKAGYAANFDVASERSDVPQLICKNNPCSSVPVAERIALLKQIDSFVRAKDSRIIQVGVTLLGSHSVIDIFRPGGECYTDIRPMVRLNVSVIMSDKGRIESGVRGAGGRHGFEHLLNRSSWQSLAEDAIRIAKVKLISKPAPAGRMSVVLDAGWPGIMVHEAVGHGLEGDAVYKGQSVYAGQLGEQVAAKGVTVIDDGTIKDRRGSLSIDDEATPTSTNVLIEDGVLKGFMHDRLSARMMSVKPTGNGRRQSYMHEVLPRMTNTYLASGDYEKTEILESVDDGIFAVSLGGGQVDVTSGDFVFKCNEAYRIRKGKIEEPVKGATIVGNGPVSMRNVSMVGRESLLDPGIGICGKAGQQVPVSVGQPMVRLDDMTVGGTEARPL